MGTSKKDQESAASSPTPDSESAATQPPKAEAAAASPPEIEPSASPAIATDLPRIEAPKLDGSTHSEPPPASEGAPQAAATAPKSAGLSRFALLAASIAVVAAIGSFAGSLAAIGVAHLVAGAPNLITADAKGAQQLSARIAAEYSTLKANVDGLSRSANAQFTKLGERLDRAERAQADPAAKIARIAEALDRLEKRGTVLPETTGSIAAPAAAQTADAKTGEKTLEGWVLHEVRRGRAILESRYGGLYEVPAGGFLPGVGRVQEIKRQDGRWVVVTSRGVISSYYQ